MTKFYYTIEKEFGLTFQDLLKSRKYHVLEVTNLVERTAFLIEMERVEESELKHIESLVRIAKSVIQFNREVKVIEAVTHVNSVSKTSKLTGSSIHIGKAIFYRTDGVFYEPIVMAGITYNVFFPKEHNKIELLPTGSKNKMITIKQWK